MPNQENVSIKNNANANVNVISALATSLDGYVTTSYADDNRVRGNAYMANDVFDLPGGATVAFALDPSALNETEGVFILPVNLQSSAEEIRYKIYEADNYTGGVVKQYYNANRNASDSYDFIVYQGVTGYETAVVLQIHSVFASSQGANESASSGGSSNALILNNAKVYIFEVENLGTGTTTVEYDTTIYQIPFS